MMLEQEGEAWRTPGGRRLCEDILSKALMDGRPCILRNRRPGAVSALRGISASDFPCDLHVVRASEEITPFQTFADLASPGANSASHGRLLELISGPELRESIVIVLVKGVELNKWITFAGTFATTRRPFEGPAAGLVLLTSDQFNAPAGCEAWDDDNIIDPLDVLLFVRERFDWGRSRLAEAASSTLVETCRGDMDLIADFVTISLNEAFNPIEVLSKMPLSNDRKELSWRDRDEPCPLWLVRNDPSRLAMRIWRGQSTVLFPWLEEVRSEVVQRGASRLVGAGLRDETSGELLAIEDFEFRHIAFAFRANGEPKRLVDAAHSLRLARNKLAHCEPLQAPELMQAENDAADLLRAMQT